MSAPIGFVGGPGEVEAVFLEESRAADRCSARSLDIPPMSQNMSWPQS